MATSYKEDTVGGKHDSKQARNDGMLSHGIFMHTVFQGSPDFAALYKSCVMHVKKHKQYARRYSQWQWQFRRTSWLAQPNTSCGRLPIGTPEVHARKWFLECALS